MLGVGNEIWIVFDVLCCKCNVNDYIGDIVMLDMVDECIE